MTQQIAATCPTAMVFVAGEHGGISHTPREYSNTQACATGVTLLANAIRRLADEPETAPDGPSTGEPWTGERCPGER